MRAVSPLRNMNEIELLKMYLKKKSIRDYTLFIIGINSNLRISDILSLKMEDIYTKNKINEYIEIREQKTNKI